MSSSTSTFSIQLPLILSKIKKKKKKKKDIIYGRATVSKETGIMNGPCTVKIMSLWKHAYSNILKILPPKNETFQIKNSAIFHISAQNIDCGYSLEPPRRGGSNEYPQSMFLSRNKKNNVYPCKPQFYYIKVGFKGVKIIKACFCDGFYYDEVSY